MSEFEFMWLAFDSSVDDVIDQAAKGVRSKMRNVARAEKVALAKRHTAAVIDWYREVQRPMPCEPTAATQPTAQPVPVADNYWMAA